MRDRRFRRLPMPFRRATPAMALTAALTVAAVLAPAVGPLPAVAQQVQRIAAVVNDQAITVYDVDARMNMVIGTSQLPDTAETRQKLLPRVLQQLVDERLKVQEATRLGLSVTDQDVEKAKRQIEQNNNFPPGSLDAQMRAKGVDPKELEKQLRADVAWVKVAQGSLRRQVSVEPAEVDAVLETLRQSLGKPQRLMAEIVLPVNDPSEEEQMRALGERLVQQMRGGAPFQPLARQFSASGTAAVGGDLGWVPQGALDPEVEAAVQALTPGQVSAPIRTAVGYQIVLLRERRDTEKPKPEDVPVRLAQLYMPTQGPAAVPAATRADTLAALSGATGCADVERVATEMRLPNSGALGTMKPSSLPAPVDAVVTGLPENKLSAPITLPDAEVVVMVCERADPSGLPSRDVIEQRLEGEKLDRAAQRALRDLRRSALIDIRL